MGSLLSEPGLEAKMDAAWSKTTESKQSEIMQDIFNGEMLWNFKRPDSKHFGHEEDEGCYVFLLGVDLFNPLSNKQSGKKVSVGIISLVCLNLPPNICYRSKHMCLVGIIPGPHELPLTTLNYYLTPLVDNFLDFWDPGMKFSWTDGHKMVDQFIAPLSALSAIFWQLTKHLGLDPSAILIFVPSVIAPVRTMAMVISLPYMAQTHKGGMSCFC